MNSPSSISLVLSLLGPDRPGLVERLSQVIVSHGGNWVESRMAQLAGQFAGILRIEVPPSRARAFESACRALATEGLQVLVAEAGSETTSRPVARRTLKLELIGQDRPGIVREIATVLAQSGINVEELATGVESAPMSAEMLFFANARLSVPEGLSTERLRAILEPIGNELMVDIQLLAPDAS